jgi:hypothetical protein
MAAFGAPEEPHLALISRPELAEPPERKVVPALGAFDLNRGLRFDIGIFIVNNGNLVFCALLFARHMFTCLDLSDIPALAALKLAARRDQHSLTFRAKHRITV